MSTYASHIVSPFKHDGKEIDVDIKPTPGVLMYPTEFEVEVSPRSDKHVALIEQLECKFSSEEKGDSELLDSLEDFEAVN